jgi:hypothetical protein
MIDERALLTAVSERRKRHGNIVVTLDLLEAIVTEAANPTNFSSWQPPAQPPQLKVPPEFPKRMVRCGSNGEIVETHVVNSFSELQALNKTGTWYRWEQE